MRCQSCDYELWHCTGRTCPECGDTFSLKDYFFEKDTVLFHCPHCDHGYKGGIPPSCLPADSIQCKECGGTIGLETYVVRPIDGCSDSSYGTLLPNRLRHGNWFTRYVQTLWLVMTKPQIAISRVSVQEPLIFAWKFYLTTLCFTLVVGLLPIIAFIGFISFMAANSPFRLYGILTVLGMQVVFGIVFTLLYILGWSLLTHLLLQLTGGSAFTFRRTMQATLYGGGATIIGIVPCFGGLVGSVWWIVSSINMLVRGQRVSGGKASFACLTGPLLVMLCICGGYIMLVASVLTPAMASARAVAQQAQQQRAAQLAQDDASIDDPEELSSDQQSPE